MKKVIVVLFLVFSFSNVYANANLRYSIFESLMYDSNIYQSNENLVGSAISSTQLFVDYLSQIPNSALKLGLGVNVGYNAYTENNSKNNYMNAGLNMSLKNDYFRFHNDFIYTSEQASNALTERAERINNEVLFGFRTKMEKMLSIGVVISDVVDHYLTSEEDLLSRNRLNAGLQFFYNVSPKTSIFVENVISFTNYEKSDVNNSTENSLALGVDGNVTAKVSGNIKFSYDKRDYVRDNIESANLFGYMAQLVYEPTKMTSVTIVGKRKMEETTYGINRYYIATGGNLLLTKQLFRKLDTSLMLSYENMMYPYGLTKREDNFYRVRPSISGQLIEKFLVTVWYQFKNRQSNIEEMKYSDNMVGLDVKFSF
ncbi:MAG: outer membrane beta-barrel protein [Endomicrobiaceae bacterium]|nr:outer membrane beta-barrel protein [Endomicrobiaceae bacterium]